MMDGGARRDRTADLVNAIHALSQLSYGPIVQKSSSRKPKLETARLDFLAPDLGWRSRRFKENAFRVSRATGPARRPAFGF